MPHAPGFTCSWGAGGLKRAFGLLPPMAGWGRERSWRFQRPHTQATTGSGSQTGNQPSRLPGGRHAKTLDLEFLAFLYRYFAVPTGPAGRRRADWPDCPRDKCPNGGVMAMDASERVEFFYESVRAIKEGRLIILIGIFIGAYPMLAACSRRAWSRSPLRNLRRRRRNESDKVSDFYGAILVFGVFWLGGLIPILIGLQWLSRGFDRRPVVGGRQRRVVLPASRSLDHPLAGHPRRGVGKSESQRRRGRRKLNIGSL